MKRSRPAGQKRLLAVSLAALACGAAGPNPGAPLPAPGSFAESGAQAASALDKQLYVAGGHWRSCDGGCDTGNQDWGDDSLTYVLYLRWLTTGDAALLPKFSALASTAVDYDPSCRGTGCGWSDVPAWDSIADEREYEVTGNAATLELARRAWLHVLQSDAFALGACPEIRYQQPLVGYQLKTLETDSNLLKAALLLWRATGDASYLDEAKKIYRAARTWFLDPQLPLYTVYVFDDGRDCTQVPRRFFASVNGNMIWSGVKLAAATGDSQYLDDALQTAAAVDQQLGDGLGIYVDLQAENDVAEPLVEAFYLLAVEQQSQLAIAWLERNAEAAIRNARIPDGLYGRFWDAPAPQAAVTAWQSNGGLALAVVAAALEPGHIVQSGDGWSGARSTAIDLSTLPASLTFTGDGIAIHGTLGENCCEPGHASVLIDGQAMTDLTGIWQNKSSANRAFPNATLFAWKWPVAGTHTLTFAVPDNNAKEGGAFLHATRYVVH